MRCDRDTTRSESTRTLHPASMPTRDSIPFSTRRDSGRTPANKNGLPGDKPSKPRVEQIVSDSANGQTPRLRGLRNRKVSTATKPSVASVADEGSGVGSGP